MDSWSGVAVPSLPGRGASPTVADTATGQHLTAAPGHTASLYACGITPYDSTHIGHAATFLAWDLLVRAWRDAGHEVTYVQNATDVDDPLLERAERDGEDWRALAEREIARYRRDMEALRVLPPDRLIGAVEALPIIERFSQRLGDRGSLYEVESDVYYARWSDRSFGAVSGLGAAAMTELFAERGGDPGRPGKKDPLDPLVWLAARPGEPSWESAFGPGRPGWHVECAAIATEYLGPRFDVQAGGNDLIFPHHEMSASHARVALADPEAFARRYAHAGMVRLEGEKMSKSLGNLVFVSGLLAGGADPMAVRLAIIAHPYGRDWDWTASGLARAQSRLESWRLALGRALAEHAGHGDAGHGDAGHGDAGRGDAGHGDAGHGDAGHGTAGRGAGGSDTAVPDAGSVLATVRERLADNLDAAGALAAVDSWAAQVSQARVLPPGSAAGAAVVRDTVDALLGVAL